MKDDPGRTLACALLFALRCATWATSAREETSPRAPSPTDMPVGQVVLTIHGKVGTRHPVLLDDKTLVALPTTTFSCLDPWDGKKHEFTGVLLSEILGWAGIQSDATRITVTGRNRYSIPIRRVDYEKYRYILAWKIDGHYFGDEEATKNRGFAIVAIDFAKHPQLDPELYKHQLVWQAIDVLVE